MNNQNTCTTATQQPQQFGMSRTLLLLVVLGIVGLALAVML